MGRQRKQFTLIRRTMSNGKKVWYYRTYNELGIRVAKTTGETSKGKAENFCLRLFKDNLLIPDSSIKLSDYIHKKNFFIFGKCEYCFDNGIRNTYADNCLSRMNNHIIPILGKVKFSELTTRKIEAWQRKLLSSETKKLSVKSVRECKTVLRIILSSARSDGYLTNDIMKSVKKLPQHSRKVRGILTESEVRNLFGPGSLEKYWNNQHYYYIASLLACFSGMRQGEILALTPEKVFENHILVNQSWSKYGLGPTKTGDTRKVYIKPDVMIKLRSIMPENGYIFSYSNGEKPLTGNRLTDSLYKALSLMGIKKEQRKERNITFHSFRHWLVTYLRGKGISNAEITSITGQKTPTVIDDYTRFDLMANNNIINALTSF